jgi:dTDP-4-amino-4,6-dideoxygalactose transaminase
MKRVPLVKPSLPTADELVPDINNILLSGRLTNFGPYSSKFEEAIALYTGAEYASVVSSGTTGLLLLLSTLPRGSEVIVPSFTFSATLQAILWNGLIPTLADISSTTYNLDPESVSRSVTPKTSAILAVNIFGNPADINGLEAIASEHRLQLFFDSAHAFGSRRDGVPLGRFGDAEVFSFRATKPLACGEGGAVVTKHDHIHRAVLQGRNYGFIPGSSGIRHRGLNGKMAEFNALLGVHGLAGLASQVKLRNELARQYRQSLSQYDGLSFQEIRPGDTCNYKDFAVHIDEDRFGVGRARVMQLLSNVGVESATYFSPAVHQLRGLSGLLYEKSHLKNTSKVAAGVLCLPMYADLAESDFDLIMEVFRYAQKCATPKPTVTG